MSRLTSRIMMIVLCCAAVTIPVYAGGASLTVGDFIHRVALARQLPAVDGMDAERLIRSTGAELPALNLDAQLTEGVVVGISRSLGLKVSTSRPDQPFQSESVNLLLDLMATQAPVPDRSTASEEPGPDPRPNDQAADPRTKGRGKKKGLPHVSESSPV